MSDTGILAAAILLRIIKSKSRPVGKLKESTHVTATDKRCGELMPAMMQVAAVCRLCLKAAADFSMIRAFQNKQRQGRQRRSLAPVFVGRKIGDLCK